MADLSSGVFQAVATPKQFLWAPFELAIANIAMAGAVMVVVIVLFQMTPVVSMVPLVVGHVILIGMGARNPHLTTTVQSSGKYPPRRRNLSPVSRGVKYVP